VISKEIISAMTSVAKALAPGKSNVDTSGERDLLLSALRAATARARLAATEFDSIGISLRQKLITCEQALQWARDEGLVGWIRLGPEASNG
jgi:hypothetical protein